MKKNISYINSGTHFSKALFFRENFYENFPIFLIVETNKDIEIYKKIFSFLQINFRVVDNYSVLLDFLNYEFDFVYITSLEILENFSLSKNQFEYFSLALQKQKKYSLEDISKKLITIGYNFSEYEFGGTFHKLGDILKIFSNDEKIKYEISFWGDEIEEIRINNKEFDNIIIGKNENIEDLENKNLDNFLEIISKNKNKFVLDNLNFSKYYDILSEKLENISSFDYIADKNFQVIDLETFIPKIENINELKNFLKKEKKEIIFYTKNSKTIENFLEYNNLGNFKIIETNLSVLKSFENKNKIIICDDILNKIFAKKRVKKSLSADLDLLLKIKPGDYVVHIEHGIGIFKNIVKREIPSNKEKIIKEYIEIAYAGEDKIFVPITEVSRVNKYLGVDKPKLTNLSGKTWEKKLQKAKKEAEEIAQELVEIYAKRKLEKGFSFLPDLKKEEEFRNSFPYIYTPDQLKTIEEVLQDMQKENPMDRLIVGDVGFGKTEIAFNAIYRSFLNKKQSIFIVPLVVLAYEHYEKAKARFKNFGLKIGVLTRLETEKNAQETIRKLASGELDLVIGTHKLLSDKIKYKDLGLIIIDEEHKFGVADKEKIKEFKTNIDALSMSATPIPRSLNMALSSIRQMSVLKTPPYGRQNVDTIISRFSENVIKEAGEREFARNGQLFFIHNRVGTIDAIAKIIKNIFPDKKIIIAHGRLPGMELEKRILAFKNKKADILISTTVIENGIDFSNVNTIIVNNAISFGLAQIHQLRGRVGRSNKKAYCYLLYKQENIKPETAKRLKTLAEYSYVGAGFELAMKDLEIRGGGDLLGFSQSGEASNIGINLYLKIIEEEIERIKSLALTSSLKREEDNKNKKIKINTKIDLDIPIYLSDSLFLSELDKINFYREIELINGLEELEEIKQEFLGKINDNQVKNFFDLLELKLRAKEFFITKIFKNGVNYQLDFYNFNDKQKDLEKLRKFLDLDKKVKFSVKDLNTLRSPVKSFANSEKFLQYMLSLVKGRILNPKIKLKGKK